MFKAAWRDFLTYFPLRAASCCADALPQLTELQVCVRPDRPPLTRLSSIVISILCSQAGNVIYTKT